MPIYRNGQFVEDHWRLADAGAAVPAAGHVILTLDWWQATRRAFDGSNVPLGLLIEPGTPIGDFAADIPRFVLIALDFPKFADGRAFSIAARLRGRHGFRGELRATGEVLLDQIQALMRSGFDSFDIRDPATEKALREGRLPFMHHFYQPGCSEETAAGAPTWRRRTA